MSTVPTTGISAGIGARTGTLASPATAAAGLAAAVTALKTTIDLLAGNLTAAARMTAAATAEARGELSKALAYRMQTMPLGLRVLGAVPLIGGIARGIHEARMLRMGMPEHIEVARILEQQRTGTYAQVNQLRVQIARQGIQAQFLTPATQAYQQRLLDLEAGPVARYKDIQAQRAGLGARIAGAQERLAEVAPRGRRPEWMPLEGAQTEFDVLTSNIKNLQKELGLINKQYKEHAEIERNIGEARKGIEKLWQKEFYMGMGPQVATHWGTFGTGVMPTQPPAPDASIGILRQIHITLEAILKLQGKAP